MKKQSKCDFDEVILDMALSKLFTTKPKMKEQSKYNFDEVIIRKNTRCAKYDATLEVFGKADLNPLWVADMDFKTPDFILEDLNKAIKHGIFGYPKQIPETFEAICAWQKEKNNLVINKQNLSLSIGVLASLSAAIETFSDIGDEVIVQSPVYYPFYSIIKANKRVLVKNPLQKDERNFYTMDYEDLKKRITPKTKILVLCSPHNPVGRIWTKEELIKLGNICLENNIKIISDEIHSDLVFSTFTPFSSISKEFAQNSLSLQAPSKTFNLAGLCASYVIAHNLELKNDFDKIMKKREATHVNSLGLISMQSAYENGSAWLEQLLAYLKQNINFVQNFLEKNTKIKFLAPQATYLLWLDFSAYKQSHKELKDFLINKCNLGLNDGVTFGKEGEKFFRLNCALSKSKLELALKDLAKFS